MATKRQFKEFCIENGDSPSIVHALISSREFVQAQECFCRAVLATPDPFENPEVKAQQIIALSNQKDALVEKIKPRAAYSDIRVAALLTPHHQA